MKDTVLKAMTRSGNAKQIRDAGCIPGVLNASDASSTSVQFEAGALSKLIAQHGSHAKVWVQMDDQKHHGFIKEVQRSPVEGKVIHVAVQLVGKDQKVKMQVAIAFHGRDELENRQLQLQVVKPEIEVSGKTDDLPDIVKVDVTNLDVNDTITPANIKLPKDVQLLDQENEIYAVIKPIRRVVEVETTTPATPEKPATTEAGTPSAVPET